MIWHALGDWGTTRLRLVRVVDGGVSGRVEGPGIGGLTQSPSTALRDAIDRLGEGTPPATIRLCGMAGARGGIHEVPYVLCPASTAEWLASAWRGEFDGTPLAIAAGLADDGGGRPDVMRGEETQIFGALALSRELAGLRSIFILPGTHSKWVTVRDGQIETFRTFMTGELFDLLATRSTLVLQDGKADEAESHLGFEAGVARATDRSGLAASLFEVRSSQLRLGKSPDWARGFLSGLVIGDEVVSMQQHAEETGPVTLIGAKSLCDRYESVLGRMGISARRMDGDACSLRGLELLDDHNG